MNVRVCVTAVAALAFLTFFGNQAHAGAPGPTTVRVCGTLAEPGSYALDRNLTASGDCLVVTANHVSIDLNGFVIGGNGSGTGVGVTMATGLVLRNGTIDGFYNGIQTSGALPTMPGALIERMTVVNNKKVGVAGGAMVVRDSVFAGNGNTAIALGDDSVALRNHVRGNLAGIHAGIGSTVEGNTVTSNTGFGIFVDCPALVIGNSSTGNSPNLGTLGTGCVLEHNLAP